MAYNYTRTYLRLNKALVERLIQLGESRSHTVVTLDLPQEAQAYRFKVNNLLSSLAHNEPKLAWVRREVRTWVRYENERWSLYIGVPPEGLSLTGPKPLPITLPVGGTIPSDSRLPNKLVIEEITRENVAEVMTTLTKAKADPRVKELWIIAPPNEAGVTWLSERLSPEFHTNAPASKPLVFERRET